MYLILHTQTNLRTLQRCPVANDLSSARVNGISSPKKKRIQLTRAALKITGKGRGQLGTDIVFQKKMVPTSAVATGNLKERSELRSKMPGTTNPYVTNSVERFKHLKPVKNGTMSRA